ncbi:MAG: alpha/beta hydrolase [Balneolaceae bacterium]
MGVLKTEIIAFHGWGLSDKFWNPWKKFIPSTISFKCANRGYFKQALSKKFQEKNSQKIVLIHSFGLHWCPVNLLRDADHLIIISGFLDFHPEEEGERRRSKLILQQMMGRFIEKPEDTLMKFYDNMYFPETCPWDPPTDLNHERLLEDLNRINDHRISLQLLQNIPSILLLHGEMDTIVSNNHARKLYHYLRFQSQYFEIKQGGHALPNTHPRQCFQLILPKLQKPEEENV